MPPLLPNPTATYALRFALLSFLYALTGWLSLTLIPAGGSGASLVWPVAAVGLAGLLFWGLNLWPALTFSFFLILIARGFAPPIAAGVALGNTIEALLGAYILMNVGFHPMMNRLRDALGLILAAFVPTIISSFIIAGSAALFVGRGLDLDLWSGIWVGHTVSLLSFAPFVIRWGYRPLFTKTPIEFIEGLLVFGTIGAIDFLIFWTPYGSLGNISLIYVLIVPLIWASLRTGPRGTSLALFMTAAISVSGILWGYSPFTGHAAQALFAMQVLIGALSLIFILFTSITEERKEAVLALEGHVGKLEDALERISTEDRAKAEFIAILAHELRNPLSPVLSGLEILKTRESGPQDVLTMMGAHLNTLARLLDDLLDITRISQKKFRLEREPVTLQAVIEQSLQMASPYLTSRDHKFIKKLPKEDIWIDADPVRLEQVFVNLLNNAAKYTPSGGSISLTLTRERDEAVIRVRDNGQGISPERLQKVFEPFAGGTRTNQGPGGLHIGLSLAKRMVELHHGSIEVKSEHKVGSEFTVHLPLPSAVQTRLIPTPRPKSRARFSKTEVADQARAADATSVMVVDDNEAAAQMLSTLLQHNGHKVFVAHSGFKALEVAAANRPRVALLDIGLPDIDGYEVGRRLRAEFDGDISLIALTGYGQQDDKDKARGAGFDDHLVKPVSIVDVERALAHLKSVTTP